MVIKIYSSTLFWRTQSFLNGHNYNDILHVQKNGHFAFPLREALKMVNLNLLISVTNAAVVLNTNARHGERRLEKGSVAADPRKETNTQNYVNNNR